MVVRNLVLSILLLGALSAVATPVSADIAPSYPPCADITVVPAGTHYVQHYDGRVHIWVEDNGYTGLQRQTCLDDDGSVVDSDAHWNQYPGMDRPQYPAGEDLPAEAEQYVVDWVDLLAGLIPGF